MASDQLSQIMEQLTASPSVSAGWNVAINLSSDAVQKLVHSNWDAGTQSTDERQMHWVAPGEVDGVHDVVSLQTQLSAPDVSLDHINQAAGLDFAIDSGLLRVGKAPADVVRNAAHPMALHDNSEVQWDDGVTITKNNPLNLSGQSPIGVKQDASANQFVVDLGLDENDLVLTSADDGGISSQAVQSNLQHWLQEQNLSGQIASFSKMGSGQNNELAPSSVAARIAQSVGGSSVLQLVTSNLAAQTAEHSDDPVPHLDGHDFSVLVSSENTMGMIVNGFNAGTGDIKLISRAPTDGQLHWFVEVHQPMVFEGTFGIEDGEDFVTDKSTMYMRFGGSSDKGLQLFTYVDPSSNVHLQLDLAAHYPTGIFGNGSQQLIGLQEGAQSITGEGFYENIVKGQLEQFLMGDIKNDMTQVRMHALSELLLNNLALSGHSLQFNVAALPAELVLAGSLNRK